MAYQCISKETKTITKNHCSNDLSYNSNYLYKQQMRNYVRKKQAAKMKFLIIFFMILGIIVPQVFITNINTIFLKKYKNKGVEIPQSVSYIDSAEFSIADNIFLDTKYIDQVNTEKPLMTSPVLTEKMSNLTRMLKNLMAGYPELNPGIFIWDYNTGKYVDINADKAYSAASIIKVPVLFQVFKRAEKGLLDLNDLMNTENAFIAEGSGIIQYFPPGIALRYKKLAELMIQDSDNTATNMLLASVGGMNEVNRAVKDWGFSTTHYYNWLPDLTGTNITTPAEMGKMFYNIENSNFLSLESRAEIVEILGHVKNRYLIQASLPYGVEFLHKSGDIGAMLGDAGTVILPDGRKYIIVIMVERPWNSYSAKKFIIEASDLAYKYISNEIF